MKKETTPAPFSKADIDALADLSKTLQEFGVYGVCAGANRPYVQLQRTRAVETIKATGVTPIIAPRPEPGTYEWELIHGGVLFFGVMQDAELKALGYTLVEGKPGKVQSA